MDVIQQGVAQPLETLVELIQALGPVAVTLRIFAGFGLWVPPDTAKLTDEIGLAGVWQRDRLAFRIVGIGLAIGQAGVTFGERVRFLVVVVAVVDLSLI